MFEVGRLIARISLDGAVTFGRDLKKARDEFKGLGEDGLAAGKDVAGAATLIGGAITAAAGVAIAKSASFDKAMSNVAASTDVSANQLGRLREAALDAGATTVYTAEEAASAIENLAKAGVGAADIYGGALAGSLALAAAGEVDVAFAAEVAATAMTQFKLAGEDVPHIADLLAAAAGKAQGDVTDMSFALKQSGLVASQFGISIEETTGTLAAFAANGLLGSDAGTSFRTMLLSLANPTGKSAELMKQYNIQAFDAQGNFVGLTALAGQLAKGFEGASTATRNQALATIFGTDAIRAANVLYSEGAAGIGDWTAKVDDAGYAAKVAAERQDNLVGDLEKLGGAFDTLLIRMGAGAQGPLRDLVQILTTIVDAFASIPEPIQGAILVGGAFVGVVTLMAGVLGFGVIKAAEFRAAMTLLSAQMPRTTAAVQGLTSSVGAGGLAAALTVVVAAAAIWIQRQQDIAATSREVKDSLDQTTGAYTDYTRELVATKLASDGVYDALEKEGFSQREVTDAVLEGGDALREMQAALAGRNNVVDFFNGSGIAAGNAGRALDGVAASLDMAKDNFEDEAAAADTSAESTQGAAEAYLAADESAEGLVVTLDELIAKIMEANGIGQDAVSSNAAYQAAIAGVATEVERQKKAYEEANGSLAGWAFTVDETTAQGSANAAMFADIAAKSQDAAEKQLALTGDTAAYKAQLEAGRAALYQQILDLTGNADAAQALTDKIYAMPSQKEIDILASTAAAQAAIDRFVFSNDGRRITITADVAPGTRTTVGNGTGFGFAGGGYFGGDDVRYYANGGREHHVAQFARGGSYRVWAEPETEGEWYIPAAPSKRDASTRVLRDAADEFGYDLVRRTGDRATVIRAGAGGAPKVEQVTEIIRLEVDGRVLTESQRKYERSVR